MATLTKQSSETRLTTENLLRGSVLVYWLILGVQIFAAPVPQGVVNSAASLTFALVAYLGFGLAFWVNTRDIPFQILGWRTILLLAYQAGCGFIISTELLYIVAAEIPLVLPRTCRKYLDNLTNLIVNCLDFLARPNRARQPCVFTAPATTACVGYNPD